MNQVTYLMNNETLNEYIYLMYKIGSLIYVHNPYIVSTQM